MWWTPQTSLPCNSPRSWMERGWKTTTKDRFDLGDGDEKKKFDELKAEIEIKGGLSWTENDHTVQEVNKAKIEAKSGLEDCCVATQFKFQTGHREETEKAVQDAWKQLDKTSWQRMMSSKPNRRTEKKPTS